MSRSQMDMENSVNKYVAQLALVLLFLAFACPVVIRAADAPAAVTDADLYKTIAALDAEVFDAYNRCDLEKFASYFIENLEFYHDKGGVMWTRQDVVEATRKNICGKVRRELVESSLAVYPIRDFGAFETGEHLFCHVGAEKCEGIGKFAMIWQNTNGHWQITRVISFDHRPAPIRSTR